jgi:hypothetical protein
MITGALGFILFAVMPFPIWPQRRVPLISWSYWEPWASSVRDLPAGGDWRPRRLGANCRLLVMRVRFLLLLLLR